VDVTNVSIYSGGALWALGALDLKRVKAARRAGWGVVERMPKTAPQWRRFLPPFHRYRDLCGNNCSFLPYSKIVVVDQIKSLECQVGRVIGPTKAWQPKYPPLDMAISSLTFLPIR
jgi:hypothetical protein